MFNKIRCGYKISGSNRNYSEVDTFEEIKNDKTFAHFLSICQEELNALIDKVNTRKTTISNMDSCKTDSRNVYPSIELPVTELNSRQVDMLLSYLKLKYITDRKVAGYNFTLQECYVKIDKSKPVSLVNVLRAKSNKKVEDKNLKKVYILQTEDFSSHNWG